jgi:hypothetical protein
MDRMKGMIEILLDKSAREDEREDAAMDLRQFNDIRVLRALFKVASDPDEEFLFSDCSESIAEICTAMNYFDENSFRKLVPYAQKIVFQMIMARNPTLIPQPLRDDWSKKFGTS